MCVRAYVRVCVCVDHVSKGACGGQKRALDLLELELQSCELSCVGARAANALSLNCSTISSLQPQTFLSLQ